MILAILALSCFAQLINSQDPCETAAFELDGSSCLASLEYADPSVCTGICGNQLSSAAAVCASSVSSHGTYDSYVYR